MIASPMRAPASYPAATAVMTSLPLLWSCCPRAMEFDLECLTRGYGEGWKVEENSFKPYACCRLPRQLTSCSTSRPNSLAAATPEEKAPTTAVGCQYL